MIWSCLRANWKKRARTRRHTRPPGRVTLEPFFPHTRPPSRVTLEPFFPSTRPPGRVTSAQATRRHYSTPWSSTAPPDHTRPFTLPRYSTPWSSIITHHHHHHSTGHSITSSQSTQIRTQPDKLSTRKKRGEDKVFGSGLDLHRITKPISAHYHSMSRAIRLLARLLSFYFVLYK